MSRRAHGRIIFCVHPRWAMVALLALCALAGLAQAWRGIGVLAKGPTFAFHQSVAPLFAKRRMLTYVPPSANDEESGIIKMPGLVVESLPNAMFRVEVQPSKHIVLATLAGKLRKARIRIVVGDSVAVDVSKTLLIPRRGTRRLGVTESARN